MKYFILYGGSWDNTWEITIRARTKQEALKRYKKHEINQYKTVKSKLQKQYGKGHYYDFIPDETVTLEHIEEAKFNKYGVLVNKDV